MKILALAVMLGAGFAQHAAPGMSAPESAASMEALRFMAGCWRTVPGSAAVLEEYYTTPSANVIVGVSRELRDGRTVQFEFSRITANETGVVLLPHPGGRPSAHGFR